MRFMKNITILSFVAVLALAVAGCGSEGTQGAGAGGAPEVIVVTLKEQPVTLTTELSGRTHAYVIAEVRPQVDGIILDRLFTEGGDVVKDMPLYKIDPDIYEARVNSAKAQLEKARANVVAEELRVKRYKAMLSSKSVGIQTYDDAVAAHKQALADVAIAKAELENTEIQLERTNVYSPISGRIGKSSVTKGALVTANQSSPLAVVQQLDPIYVDVTQSSVDLLNLKKAMAAGELQSSGENLAAVRLIMEDGSTYPHEGKLQFSDVTVNQSTGSITLRAIFPNPSEDLLPGMYVRTTLDIAHKKGAILVPQQAVTRDSKGVARVLVVKPDNTVEQRVVITMKAIGDSWLVREGVSADERVIVQGSQRVSFIAGAPAPVVTPKEKGANPGVGTASSNGADTSTLPSSVKQTETGQSAASDGAQKAGAVSEAGRGAAPSGSLPATADNS